MALNRTPTMTSNSAPSPNVASSSSFFAAGYEPYRAFNQDTGDSWDSSVNNAGWIQLDFGSGNSYVIDQYKIQAPGGGGRAPKDFTFQGSNDGSSWSTLDTKTSQSFSPSEIKTYNIGNTTAYRYYRIDVTAVETSGNLVEITEITLLSTVSSPSASLSPSASRSPSSSLSASLSPSASVSPSSSVSLSTSPSSSLSPSVSPSASVSPSSSSSRSPSPSASISPSVSPSPSQGFSQFSRESKASLPTDTNDLATLYTAQEETLVETRDDQYVNEDGAGAYMIHLFKLFIGSVPICQVECEAKSTLAPSLSPVYLQIYNYSTNAWQTVDSNGTAEADEDFELEEKIANTTNYRDNSGIITCRVYQLAI